VYALAIILCTASLVSAVKEKLSSKPK